MENNNVFIENILKAIKPIVLRKKIFVALHEPYFACNEWAYVKDCLDSGWVSSAGGYVDKFEQMLAEFTGVKYTVAVVNGTAALHICLILADVKQGDEVLVPTLTFVATANAINYCGAVPHFVDSAFDTLGINPGKLADYLKEIAELREGRCYNRLTGHRIRAMVPMHTFGNPVNLEPLLEICRRYRLILVEDAAEALGSYYNGKHVGNFGLLAALSFNGNKIITTGGGGAILTNDESLGKMAKHLTTTAKVPHKWAFYHNAVGYNYRLPNINAALGCAQLEQLPGFIRKKRALSERYRKVFSGVEGVSFFKEPRFARSNYWLNVLLLDEDYSGEKDKLLEQTNAMGIMTRPAWTLMHKLAIYQDCPKMDLSAAESIERRLINIPSSVFLGEEYE